MKNVLKQMDVSFLDKSFVNVSSERNHMPDLVFLKHPIFIYQVFTLHVKNTYHTGF